MLTWHDRAFQVYYTREHGLFYDQCRCSFSLSHKFFLSCCSFVFGYFGTKNSLESDLISYNASGSVSHRTARPLAWINPLKPNVGVWLGAGQGWASECPDVKNYKWRLNPVWHRMLYSCTKSYANSGLQRVNLLRLIVQYNILFWLQTRIKQSIFTTCPRLCGGWQLLPTIPWTEPQQPHMHGYRRLPSAM